MSLTKHRDPYYLKRVSWLWCWLVLHRRSLYIGFVCMYVCFRKGEVCVLLKDQLEVLHLVSKIIIW
jgi:hypothetical protein